MTPFQAEQTISNLMQPIFGFARSRTSSTQDAEDLTQEIVLKLYRALTTRSDITTPEKFAWTIAHLSKLRRQIVIMFYFRGKRQHEIASALNLPLGTVKWHLSNAKNELRKGMEIMKTNLKFNPITFSGVSTNGSAGFRGGNDAYLRSPLVQNILYLTRGKAMEINEIAGQLAVSPIFVEGEVEFLEENGFMLRRGKSYISNILLDMPTTESNRRRSNMYEKAAEIFAPALSEAIASNVKLIEDGVSCPHDMNFAMWALVPYLTAVSGTPDSTISFEEVATIRPDGGVNICFCTMANPDAEPIKYSESMASMGGPSWNGDDECFLWMIDTKWGINRTGNYHPDIMGRDQTSLKAHFEGKLDHENAMRMAERGFISQGELQIVHLTRGANERLVAIAKSIRDKCGAELAELKAAHTKTLLDDVPEHLRKARAYAMQHMFCSDGYFIMMLLHKLLESGKLQLPSEEQRRSIGAVVVSTSTAP